MAEFYAETATAMDQRDPNVYHHLGKIYILRKEWEKALRALEKSVELSRGENKILNSHLRYVRERLK